MPATSARPCFDSDGEWRTSVRNSASDGRAGALGGSVSFGSGYAGVSVDDLRNHYGVTAEPDVNIRMQRQARAWPRRVNGQANGGAITKLSWQASRNRYQHQGWEGDGAVGTTFKSQGSDGGWRPPTPRWRWARPSSAASLAPSGSSSTFSALGRRAWCPAPTRQTGVFLLEQLDLGGAQLTAGLRQGRVTVRSEGDADASDAKFGPAQARSFQPRSLALGATLPLGQGWQFSSNLSRSERPGLLRALRQRHPRGHRQWSRATWALRLERARGLDLGLKWEGQASHVHFNVYETRFDRYIALAATGEEVDDADERFPVYAFEACRRGCAGWSWKAASRCRPRTGRRPPSGPPGPARRRARRAPATPANPAPRLAPLRAMLGLEAQWGAWAGRLGCAAPRARRRCRCSTPPPRAAESGAWPDAPVAGGPL